MRTAWVNDQQMRLILAAMLPANRLAVMVSEATGLRISDVLALKTETIRNNRRPYVTDSKTGKRHRIYIPAELHVKMMQQAGQVWVWPGRLHPLTEHRSRQAVYKDMVRAAAVFRRAHQLDGVGTVAPHTARKRAAVREYGRGGLEAARRVLAHGDHDVGLTLLYALADRPAPRRRRAKR